MFHPELLALLPFVFATVMIFASRIAHAAVQNLVFNPGFEQLDSSSRPDGWGCFNDRDAERFELSNDEVFAGKYSLHLSSPTSTVWSPFFSKMVPLVPGSEYSLCGYCKTQLQDAEMLFALREVDVNGQSITFQSVAVPAQTDWKFLTASFKVGATTTSGQVFLLLRNGVGDAWIDEVLLVEGRPAELAELASRKPQPAFLPRHLPLIAPGTNMLGNASFERHANMLEKWQFIQGDAGQSASVDSHIAFSGSRCACQSHTTGGVPGSWLTLKEPIPIRSGGYYQLSGWLRTEGHSNWTGVPVDRAKRDEGACIILQFLDEQRNVLCDFWSRTVQTSGQWQRVQTNGKAPVNAWFMNVRLFHGDLNGKSWFDGLRLEPATKEADIAPAWRLPRDVYQAGPVPPGYRGTARLSADPTSSELCITLKIKNSVTFPAVDNSIPGRYQVTGYARSAGQSSLILRSVDVYGHVLSESVTPLKPANSWTIWKLDYSPDIAASCFTLSVRCDTGQVSLHDLHAVRVSSMNLQEYMDAPPSVPAATPQRLAASGLPSVSLSMRGCAPHISVNGKPVNFDQYWHEKVPHDRMLHSCRGGDLVMAVIMEKIDWSTTPATIDTSALDQQIKAILNRYPEAYVTITPDTTASEHSSKPWIAYNPTERYVNDLGESQVPGYSGEPRYFPSMASEKWQLDVDEMLRALVSHVKQAEYASHVIGFQLSPYEWFQWEWMRGRMDVSVPMQAAFRKWLKAKYLTDQALQTAWVDNSLTLITAAIPSTPQRRVTGDGVFRDPRKSQPSIDYGRFYNELIADLLAHQAITIKKAAGKPTVVGTFYGYITTMIDGPSRESSGHLGLARLFEHKAVDYVIAPSDGYIFEREIGGTGGYMTTADTFRLNGILWVNQPDHRTHWAADNLARTETVAEDIHVFRREFALNLTSSTAQQYLDFSTGTALGDRRIGKELAQYEKIRQFAATLEAERDISQIAVVLSETAASYVGTDKVFMDGGTVYHQRPLYYRSGIAHMTCLTSDLGNHDIGQQKLWVFPNAWHLSTDERKSIKDRCMKNGNILLYMYAPGYVTDRPSVANISQLLGLKVAVIPDRNDARVTIGSSTNLPLLHASRGMRYGHSPKFLWSPLFAVDDPKAVALGRYADGHVGLAMRDFGSYKVVYSAVGMLPPALLRDLGQAAEAHTYISTDDALYVSQHFLGLHARSSGVKRISLPRRCDIYDLISHEVIAEGVTSFTVKMDAFTTRLFYMGDANRAKAFFNISM